MGGDLDVSVNVVSAHHIQDHVGTVAVGCLLYHLDKIINAIIYCALGTKLLAGRAFLVRPCGNKYPRAQRARDLNCGGTDTGGATVHQKYVAGFQAGTPHQIAPHSEKSLWQRGSLHQPHPRGNRQALARRRHHILCVTTTIGQGADFVAHLPAIDVLAHGGNFPGHFQAEHGRGIRGRGIEPLSLHHIGTVDAGSHDTNQHFIGFRLRAVALRQPHHFGSAKLWQIDKLHMRLFLLRNKKSPALPGFYFRPA